MSTHLPSLEARVSAQERRHIILDARIEEVSQNLASISKQQAICQNLEAKLSIQEHMQTILRGRIEELSRDLTDSFRKLAEYHIQTEAKLDERFDKIDERFDKVDARIATIEANMATKEDIAAIKVDMSAMERRMLDAFKQVITVIDSRLPPLQG